LDRVFLVDKEAYVERGDNLGSQQILSDLGLEVERHTEALLRTIIGKKRRELLERPRS